ILVCLISGDNDINKTRISLYAHYLRNIFPTSDTNILELASKTIGRITVTLGIKRGEYVKNEIKRSFEWLAGERSEAKRLSACYILKELAIAMPSYFFLHINGFFNHIVIALKDPKEQIRKVAAKALRAAFVLTSQREVPGQQKRDHWYLQCYEEAMSAFCDHNARDRGLSRDDKVHGALLILNELLRCANSSWEKEYTSLMQKLDAGQDASDEMSSFNSKLQSKWPYQNYSEDKTQTVVIQESSICRQLIMDKYDKIANGKIAFFLILL
ncbi:serine/threonine-protein kinase mTOR-like, partial [Leptidea sinapis]|uniref:serine/threonine-protein kinase mTOR-like n=1 Tax=Leptidea sinapis TaxID=189913 RepID=UPI0021C4BF6E